MENHSRNPLFQRTGTPRERTCEKATEQL